MLLSHHLHNFLQTDCPFSDSLTAVVFIQNMFIIFHLELLEPWDYTLMYFYIVIRFLDSNNTF